MSAMNCFVIATVPAVRHARLTRLRAGLPRWCHRFARQMTHCSPNGWTYRALRTEMQPLGVQGADTLKRAGVFPGSGSITQLTRAEQDCGEHRVLPQQFERCFVGG